MSLVRYEQDVVTGERQEIEQLAYRNDDGDVIVLDDIEPTPKGYEVFDPSGE